MPGGLSGAAARGGIRPPRIPRGCCTVLLTTPSKDHPPAPSQGASSSLRSLKEGRLLFFAIRCHLVGGSGAMHVPLGKGRHLPTWRGLTPTHGLLHAFFRHDNAAGATSRLKCTHHTTITSGRRWLCGAALTWLIPFALGGGRKACNKPTMSQPHGQVGTSRDVVPRGTWGCHAPRQVTRSKAPVGNRQRMARRKREKSFYFFFSLLFEPYVAVPTHGASSRGGSCAVRIPGVTRPTGQPAGSQPARRNP
jgi:hypothetical protein